MPRRPHTLVTSPGATPDVTRDDDARIAQIARVLALWPHEIADRSLEGRTRLVSRLQRALRHERQRGLAGHWTYSVARHASLSRILARESADLAALQANTGLSGGSKHSGIESERQRSQVRLSSIPQAPRLTACAIRAARAARRG